MYRAAVQMLNAMSKEQMVKVNRRLWDWVLGYIAGSDPHVAKFVLKQFMKDS